MNPSEDAALRYETHVGPDAGEGSPTLVLLHGRGSHRKDLLGLAPHLPGHVMLVTPEAPHPGRPWGYGPGWAWYRYLGENRVDRETLAASLDALDRFLAGLPALLPFPPGPVVLGGFSQGGTTGLAYALGRPGKVDGVSSFSGFLADGVLEDAPEGSASRLRLFWGHGTRDPAIPHRMAREGRARLVAAGADLTARDYPVGHAIAPEELADAMAWLAGLSSVGRD